MTHSYTPPNVSGLIPVKLRATIYSAYALFGLGLGGTQVGFATAEVSQPVWLTVSLAVYAFLGTGIGYTALTHVPSTATEEASRLRG